MMPSEEDIRLALSFLSKVLLEPKMHPPTAGVGPKRVLSQEVHKDF